MYIYEYLIDVCIEINRVFMIWDFETDNILVMLREIIFLCYIHVTRKFRSEFNRSVPIIWNRVVDRTCSSESIL